MSREDRPCLQFFEGRRLERSTFLRPVPVEHYPHVGQPHEAIQLLTLVGHAAARARQGACARQPPPILEHALATCIGFEALVPVFWNQESRLVMLHWAFEDEPVVLECPVAAPTSQSIVREVHRCLYLVQHLAFPTAACRPHSVLSEPDPRPAGASFSGTTSWRMPLRASISTVIPPWESGIPSHLEGTSDVVRRDVEHCRLARPRHLIGRFPHIVWVASLTP